MFIVYFNAKVLISQLIYVQVISARSKYVPVHKQDTCSPMAIIGLDCLVAHLNFSSELSGIICATCATMPPRVALARIITTTTNVDRS